MDGWDMYAWRAWCENRRSFFVRVEGQVARVQGDIDVLQQQMIVINRATSQIQTDLAMMDQMLFCIDDYIRKYE